MRGGKSLDLAHRPRHGWLRWLAGLVLLLAALPFLRAVALAAPGLVTAYLAPAWAAERQALEAENAALHSELAAVADLREENMYLRTLLHSPAPRPAALVPARALAQDGTGMLLWCGTAEPQTGAVVLDRRGRLAGRAAKVRGHLVWVPVPEDEACFVGDDPALLHCEGADRCVTGLPVPVTARAGDLVTTPEGQWVGRLAAAPTPEEDNGCLTAAAPLCDTAAADSRYFVAVEEEKSYNG